MDTILVQGPQGTNQINVGGDHYNARNDGLFEIPEGVLGLLEAHGFSRATETRSKGKNSRTATEVRQPADLNPAV